MPMGTSDSSLGLNALMRLLFQAFQALQGLRHRKRLHCRIRDAIGCCRECSDARVSGALKGLDGKSKHARLSMMSQSFLVIRP